MEKRLDTSFYDENLKNIHALKCLPWIGKNYQNTQLLIVSEDVITDDTENEQSARDSVLFKNIEQVLLLEENPTEEQRKFLWSAIAFYNFIPYRTLKNKQLNNKNFKKRWKTFFEVVNILKPKYCLFYGIRAGDCYEIFQHCLEENNYSIMEEMKKLDEIGNMQPKFISMKDKNKNGCNLLFIEHPSKFFHWENWGELIKKQFGDVKREFPPSLLFVRQRFFIRYVS